MGRGLCLDSKGEYFDFFQNDYFDSGDSTRESNHDVTADECAKLCTQQPLCLGLSVQDPEYIDGSSCHLYFPNGEGNALEEDSLESARLLTVAGLPWEKKASGKL